MTEDNDTGFLALQELILSEHIDKVKDLSQKIESLELKYENKTYIQEHLTPVVDAHIKNNITENTIIQAHLKNVVKEQIQEDIIGNKETYSHVFEPYVAESLTKYFKRHTLAFIHSKLFKAVMATVLVALLVYVGMSIYRYFVPNSFDTFKTVLIENINNDRALHIYDLHITNKNGAYVIAGKAQNKSDIIEVGKRAYGIDKTVTIHNALQLLTPVISHKQIEANLRTIVTMFNQLQNAHVSLRYHKNIRQLMVTGTVKNDTQKTVLIDALKKVKGLKTIMVDITHGSENVPKEVYKIYKDITEDLKDLVNTAPKHFPSPINSIIKEPKL